MKRKIALLLVVAMILSLVPASMFAAPEPRGSISNAVRQTTENRTDMAGSELITVRVDVRDLAGLEFSEWPDSPGVWGIPLFVSLHGAGAGDVAFPYNLNWAAHAPDFDRSHIQPLGLADPAAQQWPISMLSNQSRGIYASRFGDETFGEGRFLYSYFARTSDQTGFIMLNMNLLPEDLDATAAAAEFLRAVNIASADVTQANRLNNAVPSLVGLNAQVLALLNGPNIENWAGTTYGALTTTLSAAVVQSGINIPVNLPGIVPAQATTTQSLVLADNLSAINAQLAAFQSALAAANTARQGLVAGSAAATTFETVTMANLLAQWTAIQANIAAFDAAAAANLAVMEAALVAAAAAATDDAIFHNPIIATWPRMPQAGLSGYLEFQVPVMRIRHADASMTVRTHSRIGNVVAEGPIANFAGAGVTIEGGDVVYFDSTAYLNPITIIENSPGAFTDPLLVAPGDRALAIRLTAPVGYTWYRGAAEAGYVRRLNRDWPQAVRTAVYPRSPHITSPFNRVLWHCNVDGVYTLPNGRQEMLIIFDNMMRNPSLHANIAAELVLENLRLIAGPNAPQEEELRVNIEVGHLCAFGFRTLTQALPNPVRPGEVTPTPPTPVPAPGAPVSPEVTVRPTPTATTPPGNNVLPSYTDMCFYFENLGRFPTAVNQVTRSDRPSGDTGLALDWTRIPTFAENVHVATRTAAALNLSVHGDPEEMRSGSAEAWNGLQRTGRTQQLRINEAVADALAMSPNHPITFTFPEGVQVVGVDYTVTGDRIAARVVRNTNAAHINSTRFVADNVVTIANPLSRSNTPQRLEINFEISVAAGFAAANDTDNIYVTVSGSGAQLLPTAGNTIAVAQVYDPIEVDFPTPIMVDQFGLEQNLLERTSFGDIVIRETAGGRLAHGDTLDVFVARSYIQRAWDITVIQGAVTVETDNGLTVSVAPLNVTVGGVQRLGYRLTVVNPSRAGTDGDTIRLSGHDIFGHVYPGEQYWIVVAGNSVSANHTTNVPNTPDGQINGVFTDMPYFGRLIDRVGGVPGADGNRANSLVGVGFCSTVMANGTPEVLFERLPGMAQEGGFIQAREFAYAAGVDSANVHWNGATGEAIIAGWDYQGNWLTVIMHRNSPSVTIVRGGEAAITGDIATIAPGTADPGTLVPVFRHNRIYLPARFLFNVFGYSADYNFERVGTRIVITPM